MYPMLSSNFPRQHRNTHMQQSKPSGTCSAGASRQTISYSLLSVLSGTPHRWSGTEPGWCPLNRTSQFILDWQGPLSTGAEQSDSGRNWIECHHGLDNVSTVVLCPVMVWNTPHIRLARRYPGPWKSVWMGGSAHVSARANETCARRSVWFPCKNVPRGG